MYIKVHESYRKVVAVCDEHLVGKKFEEGKKQLDVRENFYKDRAISKELLIPMLQRLLKEDATFNIVGEESIKTAMEAGIIHQGHVAYVQDVPFALLLI